MTAHSINASHSPILNIDEISAQVYRLACRTDFSQPGFALVKLSAQESSGGIRRKIVALKKSLSNLHFAKHGKRLGWFNMTRFDQKNTTKPHRDGAPSESILVLGYEPSEVRSSISIADYSRLSHEMGIAPETFLENFNPMYEKGLEKLKKYTTQISDFDASSFQILIINNSSAPFSSGGEQETWQGVLHSATVSEQAAARIINSTCIFPLGPLDMERIEEEQELKFVESGDFTAY